MLLALDLGTVTGWAVHTSAGVRLSGSWNLKPKRHENSFARFRGLVARIEQLHDVEAVTEIHYEAVRAHRGVEAAHAYGGFWTALGTWCDEREIPLIGHEVAAIKKFATGRGNANKGAMILAAEERWGVVVADDNEADAIAIRELALSLK